MSFWVTLNAPVPMRGRMLQSFCVDANSEEQAREVTCERLLNRTGGSIVSVKPLPYPGSPRLNPDDFPSFCLHPAKCAGRTSCPRNIACSE